MITEQDLNNNPKMAALVKNAEEKERRQKLARAANIPYRLAAAIDKAEMKAGAIPLPSPFVIFNITPIGKPRMTRRDKYAKIRTNAAWKYMNWRAEFEHLVREQDFHIGDGVQVIFLMPMLPTWSKAKKNEMRGMPHQVKPDADNMLKGFIDVLSKSDQTIYDKHPLKFWWDTGKIVVVRNKPLYKHLSEIPGVCTALERQGKIKDE